MSRPAPTIIITHTDDLYVSTDVLPARAVYALTYDGHVVDLRRVNTLTGKIFYPTTAGTAPQHLRRLADKLNARFGTDRFGIVEYVNK
jgi:hypothetical protein